MKTHKLILIALVFITFASSVNAQVGIGNTSPNALLDIQASSQLSPLKTDGLLIPRVGNLSNDGLGLNQDGMLVFLTSDSTFYFWKNSTSSWIPISSNENDENNHYVGELYGGGIVYYVFNNGANGLIASLTDLNNGSKTDWDDAVSLGSNHDGGEHSDWRLPEFLELKLLYEAAYAVNSVLGSGGLDSISPNADAENYWTSLEKDSNKAYIYKNKDGHFKDEIKSSNYLVRAVRSF